MTIFVLDKIDFKAKVVTSDRKGYYIMVKGTVKQEDIPVVKNCVPNMATPKYIKQVLRDIKEDIDSNTIILGDFNTLVTSVDRYSRKSTKQTMALNDTLDQMDPADIFSAFHPKQWNIHSFQVHRKHSPEEIMLGHKTHLSELNKIEIITCILSNHDSRKREINHTESLERMQIHGGQLACY